MAPTHVASAPTLMILRWPVAAIFFCRWGGGVGAAANRIRLRGRSCQASLAGRRDHGLLVPRWAQAIPPKHAKRKAPVGRNKRSAVPAGILRAGRDAETAFRLFRPTSTCRRAALALTLRSAGGAVQSPGPSVAKRIGVPRFLRVLPSRLPARCACRRRLSRVGHYRPREVSVPWRGARRRDHHARLVGERGLRVWQFVLWVLRGVALCRRVLSRSW